MVLMSYPDLPDYRLNYDVDGTRVYKMAEGGTQAGDPAPVLLTAANLAKALDEDSDGFKPFEAYVGRCNLIFFFPEPMVITATHIQDPHAGYLSGSVWQTSSDTTDGMDGSWITRESVQIITNTAFTHRARNDIHLLSSPITTSVLRWRVTPSIYYREILGGIGSLHLYGHPASLGSLRRLVVWDDTADVRLDPNGLNWGDPRRGTITYRTFRVKNLSATDTATQVTLTYNDLTTGGPLGASVDFSDGGAYAFSLNIGDLAPGAISPVITARLTVASDAQCGSWSARMAAIPTDWT